MAGEANGCWPFVLGIPTHDRRPSGGGRADPTIRYLPAEASAGESEYQRDQEQNQRDEKHDLRHPDRRPGDPAEAQHGRDQRDDQQRDNQAQHGLTSLTPLPPVNSRPRKTFLARGDWAALPRQRFRRIAAPGAPLLHSNMQTIAGTADRGEQAARDPHINRSRKNPITRSSAARVGSPARSMRWRVSTQCAGLLALGLAALSGTSIASKASPSSCASVSNRARRQIGSSAKRNPSTVRPSSARRRRAFASASGEACTAAALRLVSGSGSGSEGCDSTGAIRQRSSIMVRAKFPVRHMPTAPTPLPPISS